MSAFNRLFGFSQLIFRHLSYNKKRTLLTLLGLTIGISALVSLISIGLGLQGVVKRQFDQFGTDKFIVTPGGGIMSGGASSTAIELTDKDLDAVKKTPGVKSATGVMTKIATLEFGDLATSTFIIGIETNHAAREIFVETANYRVTSGRTFDVNERGRALVGWGLANGKYAFDGKNMTIGQTIAVSGRPFKIVGVLDRVGNPYDDTMVYLSIEDIKAVFNTTNYYEILALAQDGYPVDVAAENAKKRLRTLRGLSKGEEDFSIQTPSQLLDSFNSILGVVTWVVIGIAVISLVVGGVGIMNTMYTAVLERTTEIGIMKAVGAGGRDILTIFVLESGLLGIVGGVLGVVFGSVLAKAVEVAASRAGIADFYAVFDPTLLVGAIAFSFFVGTVSGAFPSRRAAMMRPAVAIRGE